jgi:hypothetical protein
MDPFDVGDLRSEIAWMSVPSYDKDDIRIIHRELQGPLEEYFNKWFWLGELTVPILKIDGLIWMSLTPMEIQSAWAPLLLAEGIVGTGGLGMGYFALKAAQDDDVAEVHVYEQDERIITYFTDSYSDRDNYDKITIHHMDVRKLKGGVFDTFFMDIYQTMLPDEVIEDSERFLRHNTAGSYRFWGQEKVALHSMNNGNSPDYVTWADAEVFRLWMDTERDIGSGGSYRDTAALPDMYDPVYGVDEIDEYISDYSTV